MGFLEVTLFRRVLVPLDCARDAEYAVTVASSIASSLGAEIRLVAVLPSADLKPTTIKSAFSYLDRVARQLAATGVRVGTQVRTGPIADGVLDEIELVAADLLVLATSFNDAFAIAERTRVPVVLVPLHAESGSKIKRVLVPMDDSFAASLALGVASELAHRTDAKLVLLRVVTSSPELSEASGAFSEYVNPDWNAEALAGAQRHVDGLARQLEKDEVDAAPAAAVGHPPEAIAEASIALSADLVVMAADAYGDTTRTFAGSVAQYVAEAAAVPVLLIPKAHRSTRDGSIRDGALVGPIGQPASRAAVRV
jgi:nucleotide-binding universal stress UspA family protein